MGCQIPMGSTCYREDDNLHHVRCKICIDVEHRENLLVPKLDGLHKHNGKRKCKCAKLGQIIGEYYTNFYTQDVKKSCIYYNTRPNFIFDFLIRWWMKKKLPKKKKKTSSLLLFSTFCNKEGLWQIMNVCKGSFIFLRLSSWPKWTWLD